MNKPELLAPVGNFEKLKYAIHYGADAVYLAGKSFGLRAFAGNFDIDELKEGIQYAHSHQVKVYVTVNIFAHNEDLEDLPAYLKLLETFGADALICADPGVIRIARQTVPQMPIHISTQANSVNWSDVLFWKEYGGVNRVVLARELTLQEITDIKEKTNMEIECFVHGAMCISYSGRCLLSNYMTERDSNKGQCAQACRWNYNLVEEKRPNEFYPIQEDEKGTYIFNSQDLCLLPYLKQLLDAGIDSLKIEGRMKSAYYVATVVRAYRQIIDHYYAGEELDVEYWMNELNKISHRPYTTGFYFDKPEDGALTLNHAGYIKPYDFIGTVLEYDPITQIAIIEQRNHFKIGDQIEFFSPQYKQKEYTITHMENIKGENLEAAIHAQEKIKLHLPFEVFPYDLIRRCVL